MSETRPTGSAHLSAGLLRAYAAGPLPEETRDAAEAHLDHCARCRERLGPLMADDAELTALWRRVDDAVDVPERSLVERWALRAGVPEDAARLCAAMPGLRRSWWAGAALLLGLAVAAARWSGSASAPLPFFALVPALSAVGVVAVTGRRFDPAYVWVEVSPLGGFRVVLLRAAAVQILSLVLGAAGAVGMPLPFPYTLGWLVPSLMLTAVCLALSSRMDALPAVALTLAAWGLCLAVAYDTALPAATRTLLPGAQLAMAGVGLVAVGALVVLRDGFERDRTRGVA
ncbi:zf-HC2 domain-containing protein [Streptomyces roseirectus]|uniref:Zf-HC2 domain-containing protein n=1 Tax=Streptomyces roseirectus TaxID=2768066 RepID=A0A7H0IHI4_9ACTN|nr:zf-HC2 domain-containing protein [Streptomyces roseirectus]QNP72250.1 zf-HC2 domain-containing protein [Streptomyces roseirectus]